MLDGTDCPLSHKITLYMLQPSVTLILVLTTVYECYTVALDEFF